MQENQKIVDWLKSPLGCDGGNIDGSIWFFGLEYGGMEQSLSWLQDEAMQEHAHVGKDYRERFPNAFPYNTKLCKLYAAMLGRSLHDYSSVFEETYMFGRPGTVPASDTYKGNIYVCAFPEENEEHFTEEFQTAFECKTKEEYKALHRTHRFPMLRAWVKEHNPKVIVCFGISYPADFVRAFHDASGDCEFMTNESGENVRAMWGMINDNKTLLIIVPFLGRFPSSLQSDAQLQEAGEIIRTVAEHELGERWCRHANHPFVSV